jgi:hypothetical protein
MHAVRELRGRLLDTTTLERAPGGLRAAVRIGSVRLPGGGVLIARVEADVGEDDTVRLSSDGGAAVASVH